MVFLNGLFGGKKTTATTPAGNTTANAPVPFSAGISNAGATEIQTGAMTPAKVCLKKATENLGNYVVDLKKKGTNFDAAAGKFDCWGIFDVSGSMSGRFKNKDPEGLSEVQRAIIDIFAAANLLDSNKELDVGTFDHRYQTPESMTMRNYENYVDAELMQKGFCTWGLTEYSNPIEHLIKEAKRTKRPLFAIFVTDGNTDHPGKVKELIKESSKYDLFIMFIGVGDGVNQEFFDELDNLPGRSIDNTGYAHAENLKSISYDVLFGDFIKWMRAKGFI